MATTNVTGDGMKKTIQQMVCATGLTAEIHGQLTFISALNIFLSITAFLGSTLILAALRKESSLHPPSMLLLRNLATTDLCVGLITQPVFVTSLMSKVKEQWNICRFVITARFLDYTLCGVSLVTLTAISVDRLLALLLRLRYKQVVTLKRTYVIVITIWVLCTASSTLMYFWNDIYHSIWYACIGISLCLVTSVLSYSKIFLTLRHRQNHVQNQAQQPNQANQLSIARYRKAVSTALWLQLTLVACYLPYVILIVSLTSYRLSSSVYLA